MTRAAPPAPRCVQVSGQRPSMDTHATLRVRSSRLGPRALASLLRRTLSRSGSREDPAPGDLAAHTRRPRVSERSDVPCLTPFAEENLLVPVGQDANFEPEGLRERPSRAAGPKTWAQRRAVGATRVIGVGCQRLPVSWVPDELGGEATSEAKDAAVAKDDPVTKDEAGAKDGSPPPTSARTPSPNPPA